MRNRNTIEFLGIWESLYNPDFKLLEFEGFKKEAGLNAFTLSPKKWINYLRHRIDFQIRTLWQHIRSQGYCVQIRKLGFGGV